MAKVHLYRSNIEASRERCNLSPEENAKIQAILTSTDAGSITFEAAGLPVQFIRALLEDPKLKPNHRAILAMLAYGLRSEHIDCHKLYPVKVASPVDFASVFGTLENKAPNCELFWNGRWYPVKLCVEFHEDESKLARHASVKVDLVMGQTKLPVTWLLESSIFLDDNGHNQKLTVLQVLERLGFRALQATANQFNIRLVNAERLASQNGQQVWVKSAVMPTVSGHRWRTSIIPQLPLGTSEMPRRCVIEATLEANTSGYTDSYSTLSSLVSKLPLVRVFSFDLKSYVFVDVDDIVAYEFDQAAFHKLYLPSEMKSVLQKVFETPAHSLFGDLIRGKHGGVVILATGAPGVGKTLTAEVYAEMSQRPLYVLEFGELGTTVQKIEENLQTIFARVVRWHAVLQFDECEIFLAKRGLDLERSAIVGIFLRMLDYYEGLLFLTTNQPSALDDAIRSRVMLSLEYPNLDTQVRANIWSTMLQAAEMTLTQGSCQDLAHPQINGRQIRNLVRLARIMHPSGQVTSQQILDLMIYSPKTSPPSPQATPPCTNIPEK